MTREEASNQINDMKTELAEYLLKKDIEALDMSVSALTEELSEDGTLTVHVSDGSKVKRVFVMGDNIFGGLYYPDSAKTDTAKPEEGAELIDRRQIKWYGCDHEGHIKGINCDTADCSKCFFATVEHDEVMSLPVYRIPDSAENKGEWIPVTERLPEEKQAVLVWCPEYKNIYCAYCANGNWWIFGAFSQIIPNAVIAWQPLPEPYNAESKDPNDLTHIFDGVTEIPKDAFKGWYTEELLEQIRAESEDEK
jgi:hypothetical protein